MSGERGPSAPAGTGTDGDAGSDGGSDGDADADEAGVLGSWSRTEMVFAVLLVVAVAGTAALFVAPGGDTTTADTDDGGAAAVTVTATPTPSSTGSTSPNVTMRVRSVESCGSRCRTVTIGLSNEGTDTARDVRVATRITTGDRLVWEGSSDVGRLDAGETVTRTRTVRVGYADAVRIKANDGRILIETTVRTANATRTFTERRTVA